MSITKNPFEHHFKGSGKPSEPKPDVTLTPSKRAAMPDPAAASAPKKRVTHGGGLPPTRKSEEAGKSAAPAAAGFQKANPFHTPKHPKVSNTGVQKEEAASWEPKKIPPAPGTPAVPASGAQAPGQAVATTGQGLEVVLPAAASNDYAKAYDKQLEDARAALAEKAAQTVTAENYREVYQAQRQLETEERLAREHQQLGDYIAARQKQLDQAAFHANKARELLAKMAGLQLRLVPNMDSAEAYKIHGEIEQLRIELAQIPFYG